MILVFLLVKPGKRFVQLGAVGIIFYSAFEEIFAEREIFTLRFDSQRLVRLIGIVHCGYAGVPRHVPGCCVPKQEHAWLERRDLSKQPQHPTPLSVFPSGMRLDKKGIGDNCAKPAQRGDESQLPEFFAKREVEFDAAEMFLPMKSRKIAFDRQFEQAHRNQDPKRDQASRHNSFP